MSRTYVVTGASRGIGAGIARHLAAEGANVVVNYRSSEAEAEAVAAELADAGAEAMTAQADVADLEEVRAMASAVHDRFGPVDVLVNNAGINVDTTFEKMTREQWDAVLEVTLGGTFNCTNAFFTDIRDSPTGRLINISSVIGKQGNFGQANYATAKSGLHGFTRSLALELARGGSTANCVAPGFTRTDMVEGVPENVQERIKENIPLGRFATVDEIACVVKFLASPEASYISGEIIDVNGAMDL